MYNNPKNILFLFIFSIFLSVAQCDAKPSRIVSTNLCSDEIILRLADKENIAAVTVHAGDSTLSTVVDKTDGIKLIEGSAEEVLLLNPDLVLSGEYTRRQESDLLKKLGINVKLVGIPRDFEQLKDYIREIGDVIDEQVRAEEMIKEIDARLEKISQKPIKSIRTVFYWPGGFTAGSDSILNAIISKAGAVNIGADANIKNKGVLDLEKLIVREPQLVLYSDYQIEVPLIRRDFLLHPAITKGIADLKQLALPSPLLHCGSPATVDAVEMLSNYIQENY